MDMEYTTPQSAPKPPDPAPEAPRVRRVGTFTMGVTMILVGILIVCSMFGWGIRLEWVFRFAPLILVALGVEVLVGAFSRGTRLKYDFLSIIVCGILTLAALAFSVIPFVLEYFGPEHEQARRSVEQQMYQKVLNSLPENSLETLDVSVSLERSVHDPETVSLQAGDRLTVAVSLLACDEADFLKKVSQINAALADAPSAVRVYYNSFVQDNTKWRLEIYDRLQLDDTPDQLRSRLDILHETEYGWMTEEEAQAQGEISALEEQAANYQAQLEEQTTNYEAQLEELRVQMEEQAASYQTQLEEQTTNYEAQLEELRVQMEEQNAV